MKLRNPAHTKAATVGAGGEQRQHQDASQDAGRRQQPVGVHRRCLDGKSICSVTFIDANSRANARAHTTTTTRPVMMDRSRNHRENDSGGSSDLPRIESDCNGFQESTPRSQRRPKCLSQRLIARFVDYMPVSK